MKTWLILPLLCLGACHSTDSTYQDMSGGRSQAALTQDIATCNQESRALEDRAVAHQACMGARGWFLESVR